MKRLPNTKPEKFNFDNKDPLDRLMRVISFSLKPASAKKFEHWVRRRRSSKTAIAKRIIEEWIEEQEDMALAKIAEKRLKTMGKTYSWKAVKRGLGL